MADWILVPCLVQLRRELDAIAPGRDRASDGSIGDAAHRASVSDHNPDEEGNVPIRDADSVNEVHGMDIDADFGPRRNDIEYRPEPKSAYFGTEAVVQFLLSRLRSGVENRLRYIIFRNRIWRASNGWVQERYTGSNPHDKHMHFSASYDTAREADTSSWHLEDLVALSEADKDWFRALFERTAQPDGGGVTSKIGRDALDQGIPNPLRPNDPDGKTPAWQLLADVAAGIKEVREEIAELHARIEEIPAAGETPADLAEQVVDKMAARLNSEPA